MGKDCHIFSFVFFVGKNMRQSFHRTDLKLLKGLTIWYFQDIRMAEKVRHGFRPAAGNFLIGPTFPIAKINFAKIPALFHRDAEAPCDHLRCLCCAYEVTGVNFVKGVCWKVCRKPFCLLDAIFRKCNVRLSLVFTENIPCRFAMTNEK